MVVKMLCTLVVLFPPSPDRTHIMRGRCNDGQIWCIIGMKEFFLRVLGHALNLQAQYTQLIHHFRHAMRHHAKVFTTYEHIGRCFKLWQLMHRFLLPEIILAAIEIVDIKMTQSFLYMRYQVAECRCLFHRNPEMEMLPLRVSFLEEKYIGDKVVKT